MSVVLASRAIAQTGDAVGGAVRGLLSRVTSQFRALTTTPVEETTPQDPAHFLQRFGMDKHAKHFASFDELLNADSKAMKCAGISVVDRKRIIRAVYHHRIGFSP